MCYRGAGEQRQGRFGTAGHKQEHSFTPGLQQGNDYSETVFHVYLARQLESCEICHMTVHLARLQAMRLFLIR